MAVSDSQEAGTLATQSKLRCRAANGPPSLDGRSGARAVPAQAQERVECLEVPIYQNATSATGPFFTGAASLCRPDRKTFTAAKQIVGGNRKTITATNFYLRIIEVGSYDQTVAGNPMMYHNDGIV